MAAVDDVLGIDSYPYPQADRCRVCRRSGRRREAKCEIDDVGNVCRGSEVMLTSIEEQRERH